MQQISQNNYFCVLLGHLSSGKTTLYNKICKTQNKTKQGGNSATQEIFVAESRFGNGFKIIDTVGFGVCSKKYQTAILQISAFQYKPLNQIILTVRFDRIDIMQAFIQMCLAPLEQYKSLITVVVTHMDLLDEESDIPLIQSLLSKNFGINQFFFVAKDTAGEYICEQIDKRMNQRAIQVQITDVNFLKNFELIEANYDLHEIVQQVYNSFVLMGKAVQNKIIQLEKDKIDEFQMDEILHSFLIWIKEQADFLLDQFYKQHGSIMNEKYVNSDNAYDSYIFASQLRNNILQNLDDITKLIYQKLIIKENHPFNHLKQCNHCGLVWLKVDGCNGETKCGKLPEQDDQINQQEKDLRVEIIYKNHNIEINLIMGQLYKKKKKIESLVSENKLLENKKSQLEKQQNNVVKKIEYFNLMSILVQRIFDSFSPNQDFNINFKLISDIDELIRKNDLQIQQLRVELQVKKDQQKKDINNQNLKGCGRTICWSKLKTPSYLLNQLVDHQLLSVLAGNEQSKKFSQQKSRDLENSIKNIIQQ